MKNKIGSYIFQRSENIFAVSQSSAASSSAYVSACSNEPVEEQLKLPRDRLAAQVVLVDSAQLMDTPTLVDVHSELWWKICQYVRNPCVFSAFAEIMPSKFLAEARRYAWAWMKYLRVAVSCLTALARI